MKAVYVEKTAPPEVLIYGEPPEPGPNDEKLQKAREMGAEKVVLQP